MPASWRAEGVDSRDDSNRKNVGLVEAYKARIISIYEL